MRVVFRIGWGVRVHPPQFIHSFFLDIYIVPLQETYSEVFSVQLRTKRNVIRSLQEENTLFQGSKHDIRGSSFQVEGPELTMSRRNEELGGKLNLKSETHLQRSVK